MIIVHGDTTTVSAAMAAFYNNVPVAHVEADLRTYNINRPYPEEFNRQIIGKIASIHFAPTESAKLNLINEKVNKENIHVTKYCN